jgi:ribosome recycling factor
VKKLKQEGMSEDDEKIWTDEVQELTDSFITKIDDLLNEKQKDILKV